MVHTIDNKKNDFHWTPLNLSASIFMGIAATAAIWIIAGFLITLFI